jgi:rhodanese-related sulfurtransferase
MLPRLYSIARLKPDHIFTGSLSNSIPLRRGYSNPPKMSNISLTNLEYISREDLAQQIKSSKSTTQSSSSTTSETSSAPQGLPSYLAVVDVRDSDHIGGHILGSTWLPSSELDYKTPELIRTMKDKEVVVFHCALSQQRGPSAALRYLREKERLESGAEVEGSEVGEGKKKQKVLVLKGGFGEWQEKYGADKELTEKWDKELWEFGN